MLEALCLVVGETDRTEGVEHRLPSDVFVLLEGIKEEACAPHAFPDLSESISKQEWALL